MFGLTRMGMELLGAQRYRDDGDSGDGGGGDSGDSGGWGGGWGSSFGTSPGSYFSSPGGWGSFGDSTPAPTAPSTPAETSFFGPSQYSSNYGSNWLSPEPSRSYYQSPVGSPTVSPAEESFFNQYAYDPRAGLTDYINAVLDYSPKTPDKGYGSTDYLQNQEERNRYADYSGLGGRTYATDENDDRSFLRKISDQLYGFNKTHPTISNLLGIGAYLVNPLLGAGYNLASSLAENNSIRGALSLLGPVGSRLGMAPTDIGYLSAIGNVADKAVKGDVAGAIGSGITSALGMNGVSLGRELAKNADRGSFESSLLGALGNNLQGGLTSYVGRSLADAMARSGESVSPGDVVGGPGNFASSGNPVMGGTFNPNTLLADTSKLANESVFKPVEPTASKTQLTPARLPQVSQPTAPVAIRPDLTRQVQNWARNSGVQSNGALNALARMMLS